MNLKAWARVILFAVMAVQGAKAFKLVPIERLLDGQSLSIGRYALAEMDILHDRAERRWIAPQGADFMAESHAAIFFDRLIRPWAGPSLAPKLMVWAVLLAAPLFIFGAMTVLAFGSEATIVALLLSAAASLGFDAFSRVLLFSGYPALWLAPFCAFFNAACFYDARFHASPRSLAAFAVSFPVLVLLDPVLGALQIAPLAVWMADSSPRPRALWAGLVAALVATALLNCFWFASFAGKVQSAGTISASTAVREMARVFLPHSPLLRDFPSFIRAGVVVFGIAEIMFLRAEKRLVADGFVLWLLSLVILILLGVCVEETYCLWPARFGCTGFVILIFLASRRAAVFFWDVKSLRFFLFLWILWYQATFQAVADYQLSAFSSADMSPPVHRSPPKS